MDTDTIGLVVLIIAIAAVFIAVRLEQRPMPFPWVAENVIAWSLG
jgi:hypothetical protein